MKLALGVTTFLAAVLSTGCASEFGPEADRGITFYVPGVANMDLGDAGIRAGLAAAGYRGQVARFTWSLSFNPAIDQVVRVIAQQGGKRLADNIQDYMDRYPGREVNLVGLSAGTGVALWALEALKPEYKVNNVVLIASSLSHTYDPRAALENVKGQIYNYYSPNDAVLAGPMKVFGSIDGLFLTDAAGSVGLTVAPDLADRVVNIRWQPEFQQYGYSGGHFDGTVPRFVQYVIAPNLRVEWDGPHGSPRTRFATDLARVLPAEHPY